MKYEDFIVQVGPDRGAGYTIRVLSSPAGEGRGLLRLPSSAQLQSQILRDLTRSLQQTRKTNATARDRELDEAGPVGDKDLRKTPEEIGGELFRALFSGQVLRLFDRSLGILQATPNLGLRIKLKLDPRQPELNQLSSLPWEFLHPPESDDYLSLSRTSPFVRYLDVPQPTTPPPLPKVLRILLVISNPLGYRQLDLMKEWRGIEAAFENQPAVKITLLSQASPAALRRELLAQPIHVLHFMGHGGFEERVGEGVLYFEGPDRGAEPVNGRILATELNDCGNLRLILLNACNTARATGTESLNPFAGVATALVLGGLPAVVAMQYAISDPAAIAFSRAFYQRLALGDPADAAVVEGRLAIRRGDPQSMEWGTPVLFMRSPDGQLFTPSPKTNVSSSLPVTSTSPATAQQRPVMEPSSRPRLRRTHLGVLMALSLGLWYVLSSGQLMWFMPITPDSSSSLRETTSHLEEETETSEAPLHTEDVIRTIEAPPTLDPDDAKEKPVIRQPTPPDTKPKPAPQAPASGTQSITDAVTGMRFRSIRAGHWLTGSPTSEVLRDPNELQQPVVLTRGFWIGETEVTQAQWLKVTGHQPSYFKYYGSDWPVENITWYDAVEFANILSEKANLDTCYVLTGCRGTLGAGRICDTAELESLSCKGYRLPTEAEWEIAARAGTTTPFNTGRFLTAAQANYFGDYPYPGTPPGQEFAGYPLRTRRFPANKWGLHETHGNVWEWTWNRFGQYAQGTAVDPVGPARGEMRVARGGGYHSEARYCRSASRLAILPEKRQQDLGLRLVRTAQ